MNLRKILILVICIVSSIANANMCDEHKAVIERAAQISGKEMKNIQFPIQKQLFTATISAIGAIPDLAGYLLGRTDGYIDFCVITFENQGQQHTCIASVNTRPDNSENVNIANCGKTSTKFWKQGAFMETTQVNGAKSSSKSTKKSIGTN